VKGFVKENGLSLFFGAIFLATLVGQALVGHSDYNHDQALHLSPTISLFRYVTSSAFGSAVMENWQSEYLQFTLYILGTVWLLQRGSSESKEMDRAGGESDDQQKVGRHARPDSPLWARVGGARTFVYSNSLLFVMLAIWLGSWFAQSLTSHTNFNAEQLSHHGPTVSWVQYLGTSNFWQQTLQNWQSEFLAVGSMAILSVYLRQRGSPESKAVGDPDTATGGAD
jgi:hypothetical protein